MRIQRSDIYALCTSMLSVEAFITLIYNNDPSYVSKNIQPCGISSYSIKVITKVVEKMYQFVVPESSFLTVSRLRVTL